MDKAAHKASELVKQDIKDAALAKETPESTEEKGGKPPKSPKKKATPKRKLRTATKKKATPKKNKPTKPTDAPETEAKDDSSGAAVAKKKCGDDNKLGSEHDESEAEPSTPKKSEKEDKKPTTPKPAKTPKTSPKKSRKKLNQDTENKPCIYCPSLVLLISL